MRFLIIYKHIRSVWFVLYVLYFHASGHELVLNWESKILESLARLCQEVSLLDSQNDLDWTGPLKVQTPHWRAGPTSELNQVTQGLVHTSSAYFRGQSLHWYLRHSKTCKPEIWQGQWFLSVTVIALGIHSQPKYLNSDSNLPLAKRKGSAKADLRESIQEAFLF